MIHLTVGALSLMILLLILVLLWGQPAAASADRAHSEYLETRVTYAYATITTYQLTEAAVHRTVCPPYPDRSCSW